MTVATALPLRTWLDRDGKLLRLRLMRPKANIIDGEMILAFGDALDTHARLPELLGVLIDAEGPHFSFGASVEEHLPGRYPMMLAGLHALIVQMLAFPVPILVAARGQCLGGGLELACAASMIFASSDSMFGQPEIKLGVFAPAASCLLHDRIGRAAAEELLFSGRSITGQQAWELGLVQTVADDPEAAAVSWFDLYLADKSAAALRCAVRATRLDYVEEVRGKLARVEALYREDLMSTRDALEGLEAFLARRPARWEHR